MTHLSYHLDRRFPIAVIRLSGELIAGCEAPLREAVQRALVEEPTSLIIDLAGIGGEDPWAATALVQLAAEAERWPGTSVLLCRAPSGLAESVRRRDGARVAVYPEFAQALADAATAPLPRRVHTRLESTVHAPRAARDAVADACAEWDLPGWVVPTEIIASELVTNAVRHAGTVLDLRITLRDHLLRVSVQDRNPAMARPVTASSSDHHGRGLLIIGSVAASWGSEPIADGKVVWATLRLPRGPQGPGGA